MINRLWAVHPAKLRAVVVTLMSAIIALSGCGGGHASPAALELGTIIVYDSNQLWLLDPSTGDLTPYVELGEEGVTQITRVTVSPDARFIYAIVGAQLIQIDTESLETRELLTYPRLFSANLSPDGRRAVLRYFREEQYYPGFCVLDISQGRCEQSESPVTARSLYWIDNRQFVAKGGRGVSDLIVVDAETLEARPLHVPSATSFDHIPETQEILFAQADYGGDVSFFTIDVNTLQTSRRPYTVRAFSVNGLQISPDGRHFLFYDRSPDDIALAKSDSGEIIAEIDSIHMAAWMPDSQGLVLLRYFEYYVHPIAIRLPIPGQTIQIMLRPPQRRAYYTVELFDLDTRQSEILHTFDWWSVSVVTVP
jgi:hypothetical protein